MALTFVLGIGSTLLAAATQSPPRLSLHLASPLSSQASVKLLGTPANRYRLETAPETAGPGLPAAELALPTGEWVWQGLSLQGATRQFFRAAEMSTPSQVGYLPIFRLLDLTGKSRDLYYHTHLKGIALAAAGPVAPLGAPYAPARTQHVVGGHLSQR